MQQDVKWKKPGKSTRETVRLLTTLNLFQKEVVQQTGLIFVLSPSDKMILFLAIEMDHLNETTGQPEKGNK
jgi:hypothetical protein